MRKTSSLFLHLSFRRCFIAASLVLSAGCQEDAEQPSSIDVVVSGEESLHGVIECDRFVIVAGATVTASGDLSIHATEEIVIDGTLVGAGVELLLVSDGSFSSHGEIRNLLNESGSAGRVSIDARRLVDLSGASVVTDLPTTIRAGKFDEVEGDSAEIRLHEFTFDANPSAADSLPPWTAGGAPDRGANLEIRCTGRVSFLGGNELRTRPGRAAPAREWRSEEPSPVTGLDGGPGGRIDVIARDIHMEGETRFRTGNGGAGGDMRDVAPSYRDRPARTASATGGNGGSGGTAALLAERRFTSSSAVYWFDLGVGGRGGSAEAVGATGLTSSAGIAGAGGNAEAFGGLGGSGGNLLLAGSERFESPAFDGRGGEGASGGDATALPGRGADGTPTSRDGGHSGAAIAHGGSGGLGGALSSPGVIGSPPFSAGGDGGVAIVAGGGGGNGYGVCDDGVGAGGRGGDGGRVELHEGVAGVGSRPGVSRPARTQQAGNAGAGGDGAFLGRGGVPGEKVEVITVPVEQSGLNFTEGGDGEWCPVGACCFPEGTCQVRTAVRCETQSGYYWGDGLPCDPSPCVGACCFDDDVCRVVLRIECTSDRFFGPASECDPIPCPLIGSCCREAGDCVLTTHEDCGNGQFNDVGTGCDEEGCGTIGGFYICCLPDGSCDGMPSLECQLRGGRAIHDSPCPPRGGCAVRIGACCVGDQCALRFRNDCAALEGEYHGEGSLCDPNRCPE